MTNIAFFSDGVNDGFSGPKLVMCAFGSRKGSSSPNDVIFVGVHARRGDYDR